MNTPEPATLRAAACEFARAAGAILREGHGRVHAPEKKGRIDLVTEYARRSEAMLLRCIRERFPEHAILAEESGVHAGIAPAPDNTARASAGAVYDPVRDELFSAAAGEGATLNDRTIRVAPVARLEDALLVTGFPYDVREHPERHLPLFQEFLMHAQGIRRDGSAALNLCYLAMGRFDGMWEGSLSPWDIAAGSLIVGEAGGVITGYAGEPLRLDGRRIAAANPVLHARMLELIARHPEAGVALS